MYGNHLHNNDVQIYTLGNIDYFNSMFGGLNDNLQTVLF